MSQITDSVNSILEPMMREVVDKNPQDIVRAWGE